MEYEHTERSQVNKVKPENESQHTDSSNNAVNLCEVMLKQNDIAEMLVKQQKLTHLPQKDIPFFSGDLLEFKFYIRAFDYTIHDKTDNDNDRLYYTTLNSLPEVSPETWSGVANI